VTDLAGQGRDAGRLDWVDTAKGLCIILVVMMHSTLGTQEAMGGEGFLGAVVTFAKPFRIPDFFLLSGLFLGRVIDRDWRLFADRRVVHFAYFYLLWLVIQSVAKYSEVAQNGGPAAFLAHLAEGLIEPYSTLWFIYMLAVFSVVTKLLRRLPPAALLAGAALLQIVPISTDSYLIEEFCARYVYFVGGYLFAGPIFRLAATVGRRPGAALAGLAVWAVVNGWLAMSPSGLPGYPTLASLPVVGLLIGSAGALAIVASASLLVRAGGPLTEALRACGARSIVIYLGFFLPMAATRIILVKTGLITDIGVACLVVTLVALLVPLAFERVIRGTWLDFLFRRPRWLHIADAPKARRAALETA